MIEHRTNNECVQIRRVCSDHRHENNPLLFILPDHMLVDYTVVCFVIMTSTVHPIQYQYTGHTYVRMYVQNNNKPITLEKDIESEKVEDGWLL